MKIKWLGHASFLITASNGTTVITDPYTPGNGLSYADVNEAADIVTVSHEHGDHNNVKAVKGNPQIIRDAGIKEVKGITFKGVQVNHDPAGGHLRGKNVIFCFSVDNLNVCHLGDLGHVLNQQQLSEIGTVDILLLPVGGFFTIDAKEAGNVADSIKPKVIVPMHYKNEKCSFPIGGVDKFIKDKKNVRKLNSSEFEITREALPSQTEIFVPVPAR